MHSQLTELKPLLLEHYQRYPQMTIQDLVKLIFQNEFAGGHMVTCELASLQRLQEECQGLDAIASVMFEDIGNNLCRLRLQAIRPSGVQLSTVNRFFVNTALSRRGRVSSFEQKLDLLRSCCEEGVLPFQTADLEAYLRTYRERGYPAVSHSQVYRQSYRPAYRVVGAEYRDYFPIFSRIDRLLKHSDDLVCVAIDGNSGAGKSTLAKLIQAIYDCNVFHMDDYFLPPQMKTEQRLAEAGGNVDYERFLHEVIAGIASRQEFCYSPYDCQQQALMPAISVAPSRLNVVEGVYSLHPVLADSYQLKAFLAIEPEKQLERIAARSGTAILERFQREWIPLENHYFERLQIAAQCDLVFSAEEARVCHSASSEGLCD